MKKRIITALFIIAVVIPPLIFGGPLLDMLIFLVVIVGGFEMVHVLDIREEIPSIWFFLLFFSVALASQLDVQYGLSLVAIILLAVIAVPVFYREITTYISFYILGVSILLFGFAFSFLSIYHFNHLYVWFVMIATYGSDTGAYLAGSMFGKRKLIPQISPKKTVEGAIGGWLIGFILSFAFGTLLISDMNIYLLIVGSITLPVISQIGDLSFSVIKRNFGIKDFSNVFPGHGGFMDRIDSLVYNIGVFSVLLVLFV